MAQLEVTVGADLSDLQRGIRDAEQELSRLKALRVTNIRLGLDVTELNRQIFRTQENLVDLRGNFQRASISATGAATAVSSVVAPLRDLGGSTAVVADGVGILSSALSGGLAGALSAVTGYLVKMYLEAQKAANELNEIARASTKTAAVEISSVKAYLSVATDRNLSDEKRMIAVKKLQDEYPAYFGNLTKEKILNGEVANAVNDLSIALRSRATASAIATKMGEIAIKRLDLEEKREQAILDIKNAQAQVAKSRNGNGSIFINEEGVLKATVQTYKEIVKDIKELDAQSKKYSDRENKATADSILLLKEKEKVLKEKKTYNTPQVSPLETKVDTSGLVDLSGMLVQVAKKGKESIKGYEGDITTSFKGITKNVSTETLAILKLLYDFNKEVDTLVKGSLTRTFEDLGTSIGEALAQGKNVFGAIGKTLIASLGSFLSDMGGLLIKYGTLAVAKGVIDKALTSGNPVVTIGAGVAAIAVGVALKATGGAISSKANASGGSGSYSTGASYSSPGGSSGRSGGSSSYSSGTVVFEISGNSLIGVLQNTLNSNKRLGGSLGL